MNIDNCKIVIPARRNSKGFPFKNRKLFNYTIKSIPQKYLSNVIVTTDDEYIQSECEKMDINYFKRNTTTASDTASIKSVLLELKSHGKLVNDDIVIMLYLTYPERIWDDIMMAYLFFIKRNADSLLCKKEITGVHPYLCLLEKNKYNGRQLKRHNLYRRQDYPKMFEISHFISIFRVKELKKLNNNIYNKNTIFYPIDNKIDVDYESTLMEFIDAAKKDI